MMNSNTSSNSSLYVVLFLCSTLVMLCLSSSSASSIPNDDGSNYQDKLPSQDEAIELFLNDDDDSNYLDKLPSQDEAIELFLKWKKEQGKVYRDLEEMAKRFEIFLSTLKRITEHNANRKSPSSYVLGLTEFADWSHEEFIGKYLHKSDDSNDCCLDDSTDDKLTDEPNGTTPLNYSNCVAPSSLDWRITGVVTDVKHQNRPNKCGSCWAFSAAGAIEGIYAIKAKKAAVSLSAQELVDCETKKSQGCKSGSYIQAFKWVISNKGIASDEDYPYTAKQGTCKASKVKTSAAIKGYNRLPKTEEGLLCAVVSQPISVGLNFPDDYKDYKNRVYDNKNCGSSTNCKHAMLIVGYDTAPDGTKYWILKNTAGTNWGINGYMHMARDTDLPLGVCNINNQAVAPTIN